MAGKEGTVKKKKESKTTKAPPIDGTESEYKDLLGIAASLTQEEAENELIESARYGEIDCVKALLEIWSEKNPDFVNCTDKNGSTSLHKACANGHESCVQMLLFKKAKHLPNNTGNNTPLHWAAANGHENVVEMLLMHDFSYQPNAIDVLVKNSGGRSALTEGFSSEKTKLVGMLLEHDSAAEERLLMGAKEVDEDGNDVQIDDNGKTKSGSDNDVKNSITHEFDFLRDENEEKVKEPTSADEKLILGDDADVKTLLIRELPIKNADNPFDEGDDKLDTTGLGIWSASLVMARWMASKASLGRFDGKNVLELGAGCGVPGLTVGLYSDAKIVYMTDYNPATIENMKFNIDINANRSATKSRAGDWLERIRPMSIDWADESTWPKEKMDYVIGSDLIYQKSIVPLLKRVVNGLIKNDGSFLYTCPSDGRDGLKEFIEVMKKEGFRCVSEEVAPDLYRSNPLHSGDAEDAFLHFYELPVTEYKLFEFKKRK